MEGLGRDQSLALDPGRVTYPRFGRACPRLEAASLAPRLSPCADTYYCSPTLQTTAGTMVRIREI
jgi:hypothetical protein